MYEYCKTQKSLLFFINIHYGIYWMIKSNLFRYPIEKVNSKSGAKKKRGVKCGNEKNNNNNKKNTK